MMNRRSLGVLAFVGLATVLVGLMLWTGSEKKLSSTPETAEAEAQGALSPEVESYYKETETIDRKTEEIAQYLSSLEQSHRNAEPGAASSASVNSFTSLMDLSKECLKQGAACGDQNQAQIVSALGRISNETWSSDEIAQVLEKLDGLALISPPLAIAAIDFAVDQKDLKFLHRLLGLEGLHAHSRAYLIEASAYQNDQGLRRKGRGLLERMLRRGSVAEALAATAKIHHFPEMNDRTLAELKSSLCRFRSKEELGFELMKTRINRLARVNPSSNDTELDCNT